MKTLFIGRRIQRYKVKLTSANNFLSPENWSSTIKPGFIHFICNWFKAVPFKKKKSFHAIWNGFDMRSFNLHSNCKESVIKVSMYVWDRLCNMIYDLLIVPFQKSKCYNDNIMFWKMDFYRCFNIKTTVRLRYPTLIAFEIFFLLKIRSEGNMRNLMHVSPRWISEIYF